MNPYRRGLRHGVLVNPKLFVIEKVNLAPPTVGWSTWSNLVKLVKNLYYLVRVITIDRYKARLVVKRYAQRYGIDYQDTFARVAKINTICILISIAANRDWPLQQFDVKNAFLNGDLEEEVYMELPFEVKNGSSCKGEVFKLKKSMYELKHSPKAWFGRFSTTMKESAYKQSNSNHTLFIKHKEGKSDSFNCVC